MSYHHHAADAAPPRKRPDLAPLNAIYGQLPPSIIVGSNIDNGDQHPVSATAPLAPLKPPLSPSEPSPYVFSIIQDVRARVSGNASCLESWKKYRVESHEWDILQQFLDNEKWRFDYFSETKSFVHSMPSAIHDVTVGGFARLVLQAIALLCPGTEEGKLIKRRIISRRSTNVEHEILSDKHEPDDFIAYRGTREYGLVLEVAFSQKSADLDALAKFYLLNAYRKAQVTVGIDIDPTGTKRVTLLTWKLNDAGRISKYTQQLRTETGEVIPGPSLQIPLLDFAPRNLVPLSLHKATIEISVEEICDVIEDAEIEEASQRNPSASSAASPTPNNTAHATD